MKKLLFILPVIFFTLAANAQETQTEDEVYIGKGKTFGNYKGTKDSKPIKGEIKGVVIGLKKGSTDAWCEEDCLTILVKQDDGTIVTIGTRDYGFTVPKELIGKRIIVEGVDVTTSYIRRRKTINQDYQRDIQFAATGIKIN